MQTPLVHVLPAAQRLLHAPQLRVSELSWSQVRLQGLEIAVQTLGVADVDDVNEVSTVFVVEVALVLEVFEDVVLFEKIDVESLRILLRLRDAVSIKVEVTLVVVVSESIVVFGKGGVEVLRPLKLVDVVLVEIEVELPKLLLVLIDVPFGTVTVLEVGKLVNEELSCNVLEMDIVDSDVLDNDAIDEAVLDSHVLVVDRFDHVVLDICLLSDGASEEDTFGTNVTEEDMVAMNVIEGNCVKDEALSDEELLNGGGRVSELLVNEVIDEESLIEVFGDNVLLVMSDGEVTDGELLDKEEQDNKPPEDKLLSGKVLSVLRSEDLLDNDILDNEVTGNETTEDDMIGTDVTECTLENDVLDDILVGGNDMLKDVIVTNLVGVSEDVLDSRLNITLDVFDVSEDERGAVICDVELHEFKEREDKF